MDKIASLLPSGIRLDVVSLIIAQILAAIGAYIALRERLARVEATLTHHSDLLKDSQSQIREARRDIDGVAGVVGTTRSKSQAPPKND